MTFIAQSGSATHETNMQFGFSYPFLLRKQPRLGKNAIYFRSGSSILCVNNFHQNGNALFCWPTSKAVNECTDARVRQHTPETAPPGSLVFASFNKLFTVCKARQTRSVSSSDVQPSFFCLHAHKNWVHCGAGPTITIRTGAHTHIPCRVPTLSRAGCVSKRKRTSQFGQYKSMFACFFGIIFVKICFHLYCLPCSVTGVSIAVSVVQTVFFFFFCLVLQVRSISTSALFCSRGVCYLSAVVMVNVTYK